MKDTLVSLRVNEELKRKIEDVAKNTNSSTSDFIRNCLEEAVYNNEDSDFQLSLLKKKLVMIEDLLSKNNTMCILGNATIDLNYDSHIVKISNWMSAHETYLTPMIQITLLTEGKITFNTYIDNTQKIESIKVVDLDGSEKDILCIRNI